MKVLICDKEQKLYSSDGGIDALLHQMGVQPLFESEQLDEIDACIVNGLDNPLHFTYITAFLLAKKKPVLFLLPKGEALPDLVHQLRSEKNFSSFFFVKFWEEGSLSKALQSFFEQVGNSLKEVPSIKFTLRITPSMERYLQWKHKQTGESKADFLRRVINEDIINKDLDYRK